MRIVLTGGGTGGHLTPLEPLINVFRTAFEEKKDELPVWLERNKLEIYFLGVVDKKTSDFYHRLGLKVINIPAAKLRRYPSPRTFTDLFFRMPLGLIKATVKMWRIMPDIVISKGGYGSIPVSLAAFIFRVPLLLHESDSVMGLANKTVSIWAQVVTVGFAETRHNMKYQKRKTIVTGTPVRAGLNRETPEQAKEMFGFAEDDPVILVIGGSQGAEQINKLILETLPQLIDKMGIIHLTGPLNLDKTKKRADEILAANKRAQYYKPFSYLEEKIGPAYMAADLVISRAGATSLAELARLKKPAIIIPLPTAAKDHQRINAQIFDVANAARVISQENLSRNILLQNINYLMENKEARETLSSNIAHFDYPNAARDITNLAFKLASGLLPFQAARNIKEDKEKEQIKQADKNA